jgi:TP901 family phage tail tape measure protein
MAVRIPIVTVFDSKGLKQAQYQLNKVRGNFAAIGRNFAIAGAAIGGFASVSVKAFADFDAALTKSTAIMGNLSDEMRTKMSNTARDVAKATTFSAEQAAEAYFFLASAGLDAESSIAALPQVARFAQAGMFDMAQATDLLTDAQSALGMVIKGDSIANLEEMTRLSDVLVKANTLANASVQQFSEALTTKAGAALKAVNKDVTEGVAVLAALADQGIKGANAGTQLSIVLRDLTTKAIRNKAAFAQAGIAVFDTAGNMNNLGDIISDLEGALAGMSDETQKATLLQLGFSDKSLASLTALLGTSEAVKTYEASLRSASGFTDDVASKQLDTFNAQLQLLKSAFVDVGISVGQQLEPALRNLIPQLQAALPLLGEKLVAAVSAVDWVALIESIGKFTVFLIENAEAIGKIIAALFILNTTYHLGKVAVGLYTAATLILKTTMEATTVSAKILRTALFLGGVTLAVGAVIDEYRRLKTAIQESNSEMTRFNTEVVAVSGAAAKLNPMVDIWNKITKAILGAVTANRTFNSESGPGAKGGPVPSGPRGADAAEAWARANGLTPPKAGTPAPPKIKAPAIPKSVTAGAKAATKAVKNTQILNKKQQKLMLEQERWEKQHAREQAALAKVAAAAAEEARKLAEAQEEAARIEADALAERERNYKSFADSVKGTFSTIKEQILGAFTLPQLGGSTDAIIRNMDKLLTRVKGFSANITKLSEMGLDPKLLQQVINAGPIAGAKLAANLVSGGVAGLNAINTGYSELSAVSSQIGMTGTQALYGNQQQQTIFNIEVNGGLDSSASVGQAVVDAIKAYERTSGAIWARA